MIQQDISYYTLIDTASYYVTTLLLIRQIYVTIPQLIQQAITQSLTLLYPYDTATIPLLIQQAIMTRASYRHNNL